jgi:DNA-nicking Smr family endonuclease
MPPKSRSTALSKVTEKKPRAPTFAELLAGESRSMRSAPLGGGAISPGKAAPRRVTRDPALEAEPLKVVQQGERVEALAPGTPGNVLRELKQGKQPPELTIDVHGLTSTQAVRMVEALLNSAVESALRTVLIVYGRGLHSPEGPVLPGVVVDYLSRVRPASILALCSAPPKWGGPGALLVRLRRPR